MKALAVFLPALAALAIGACAPQDPANLYVDPAAGKDDAAGTAAAPLRTIAAAVAKVPAEVRATVTIHLRPGAHTEPAGMLHLSRRTHPGASVRLQGEGAGVVLDWAGGDFMIAVRDGDWWLANVQLGSRRDTQPQGVVAESPGRLSLRDVRIRTRSASGYAIEARRAGRVELYGRIEINEDLHERAPADTFAGIHATDHGTVKCMEREKSSLSMGNGSLGASYYGCVRLGCGSARITSWTMANTVGIGNSGRVDFHGTPTTLRAGHPKNALIGPEDDGHIMAEDTHVVLEAIGESDVAIALQKRSALFGTNFELRGRFKFAIVAQSGSTFGGVLKGNVTAIEATTGAHVSLVPPSESPEQVFARWGAVVVLPDGRRVDQDALDPGE